MTLLIYAHPQTEGSNPLILAEVEAFLKEKDFSYEVLDLYKMSYDPILHEDEHYTAGRKDISEQNREIQKKIGETDTLIFIHPVWWYSMPAVLKGFLDRVLTSKWAFQYRKVGPVWVPFGLLKGKKAIIFMTTGSPWWAFWHPGVRASQQVVKRALTFCGIKAKRVQFWGSGMVDDKRRSLIKKRVPRALARFYGT